VLIGHARAVEQTQTVGATYPQDDGATLSSVGSEATDWVTVGLSLNCSRGLRSYLSPESHADLWSVLGRWIRDTPWFRLVSDGAKSPFQNTFRNHDEEGLQALLKPVSQVRILPGALASLQLSSFSRISSKSCAICVPSVGSDPTLIAVIVAELLRTRPQHPRSARRGLARVLETVRRPHLLDGTELPRATV
jgi:hypothetical protein